MVKIKVGISFKRLQFIFFHSYVSSIAPKMTMCGEIIPRRVLCPWRAHLLASTLPAVARATAACFVRCGWLVGRGVGLLGVSSSH